MYIITVCNRCPNTILLTPSHPNPRTEFVLLTPNGTFLSAKAENDPFASWGFPGNYHLLIIFNNNKVIHFTYESLVHLYEYKNNEKIACISFISTFLGLSFTPIKWC